MVTSSQVSDVESGVSVKPDKRGFSDEDKEQMKKFGKGAAGPLILGQLTAITVIVLTLNDVIDFSKLVTIDVHSLADIQSRIGFVLKYSTTGVLWIIRCLFTIMYRRTTSPAMDPTCGADHLLVRQRNVLNNSMEQFILSLVSQLILVQYLTSEETVKYIPVLSQLFIIGRVTYWLGYPKYRLFGFMLNIIPLTTTMSYNTYKFYGSYFD